MGRSSAPPLAAFSRQVIAYVVRRLVDDGRDASGRWLASQIGMSHNYVAKRLRYELPFTTTDVERIALTFGESTLGFVTAAIGRVYSSDPVEQAIAAERAGAVSGAAGARDARVEIEGVVDDDDDHDPGNHV